MDTVNHMNYSYISDKDIENMSDEDLLKSIETCAIGEEYGIHSPCDECPQRMFLRHSSETVCEQYIYKEAARRWVACKKHMSDVEDDVK